MSYAILIRSACMTLVVMSALTFAACKSEVARQREEQASRETRRTETKKELATKFGAISDWKATFGKRLPSHTIDLQEALIRSDKKPILVEAFVQDITRENDRYIAHLSPWELPEIELFLECTTELAAKLRSKDTLRVAVIVSISSVRKPAIKLEASPPDDPEDSPTIEVTSSEVFIAKGSLLAVEFLD